MNRPIRHALMPALLAAALTGCAASPPVHYYTLLEPDLAAAPAAASASASGPAAASVPQGNGKPPYLLDVLPVTVPPQADQPQIMMREAGGAVAAYYSDRWTAPLADEIRGALSYNLVRDLGVLDVQSINAPAGAALWRVQVDVQRFDAMAGRAAVLDATWRVRPVNLAGQTLLCRSLIQVPMDGATPARAVAAQQQAALALAATIASGIRAGGGQAQPANETVQLQGCRAG